MLEKFFLKNNIPLVDMQEFMTRTSSFEIGLQMLSRYINVIEDATQKYGRKKVVGAR
jgi:hypothetical protein